MKIVGDTQNIIHSNLVRSTQLPYSDELLANHAYSTTKINIDGLNWRMLQMHRTYPSNALHKILTIKKYQKTWL